MSITYQRSGSLVDTQYRTSLRYLSWFELLLSFPPVLLSHIPSIPLPFPTLRHPPLPFSCQPQSEFIRTIKQLRAARPHGFCNVATYGGIFFRFIKGSDTLLGPREDSAMVDIQYFRNTNYSMPRVNGVSPGT